jgi:alpha-D-ribose 1-methylphosphonate 5-triphosphate synthase subunit PhnG
MAASDIVGGQTSGLKSDAFHARKAEVANVHKELQEQLDHRVAARANHCEISQVNFMDKLRHEDQSMCAK